MDASSHHHEPYGPGPMAPLTCQHGYPSYSTACQPGVCPHVESGSAIEAKFPLLVCTHGFPSISGGCEH